MATHRRLAALVVIGCGSSHAPPPSNTTPVARPEPRGSLAGDYTTEHAIAMVCEPPGQGLECEETVSDRMQLTEMPGGVLHARIELLQTNAHSCTFDGDLVPAGDRHWTFDEPAGEEGPCHVDLFQRDARLELTSEGCRYYCGARATLEGAFAYPPGR
jgi:hypothetical protein